jgi:hypothetical protein
LEAEHVATLRSIDWFYSSFADLWQLLGGAADLLVVDWLQN